MCSRVGAFLSVLTGKTMGPAKTAEHARAFRRAMSCPVHTAPFPLPARRASPGNMTSFDLYGTTTSPFVRRVRVVALEKQIPFALVSTNEPDGQARLRALSPVWKVPTARFTEGPLAGAVIWDSRAIVDALTADGWGPLRAPPLDLATRLDEENTVNAIDEALLALIRLFYLKKDGFPADAPMHDKDRARVDNILGWVSGRVREGRFVGAWGAGQGFGRAELNLVTALGWMRFRQMADVDRWPALAAFEKAWADRPSLVETRPG